MFLKILDYFRLNHFEIFEPTRIDRYLGNKFENKNQRTLITKFPKVLTKTLKLKNGKILFQEQSVWVRYLK
jgi:hypothetical protein